MTATEVRGRVAGRIVLGDCKMRRKQATIEPGGDPRE